jgi:hypothetical protein
MGSIFLVHATKSVGNETARTAQPLDRSLTPGDKRSGHFVVGQLYELTAAGAREKTRLVV